MKPLKYVWPIVLMATQCFAADHIVILFDTSGSMKEPMYDPVTKTNGRKVDIARTALIKVVDQIPADTEVGLLTFNGWVYQLGPLDKKKLVDAINTIKSPDGGTPLGQYIQAAGEALLKSREKNKTGRYQELIVTDGEANDPPRNDSTLMNEVVKQVKSRGLVLDTIGLDMKSGAKHSLAAASRKYMPANDPQSLVLAISSVIAEIGSVGSSVTAEALAELEGLPDETAAAILEAMTADKPPTGLSKPPESPDRSGLNHGLIIVGSIVAVGVVFFAICHLCSRGDW